MTYAFNYIKKKHFSFQVQFHYSAVGAEKQACISGFQERYANIFQLHFKNRLYSNSYSILDQLIQSFEKKCELKSDISVFYHFPYS